MKITEKTMDYEGHQLTTYDVRRNNGFTVTLKMWGYSTRSSWGHKGEIWAYNNKTGASTKYASKKIIYYNRTWESWQFQTLARELLEAVTTKENATDTKAVMKALDGYEGAR